jgi:hypothetical protein
LRCAAPLEISGGVQEVWCDRISNPSSTSPARPSRAASPAPRRRLRRVPPPSSACAPPSAAPPSATTSASVVSGNLRASKFGRY